MTERAPFGYVVAVEGPSVRLNLLDVHRGQVAAHADGLSPVTEMGGLFAVDGGVRLLVLRVRSLSFAEPREAHRSGVGTSALQGEPLRHLEAVVVGTLTSREGKSRFTADSLVSPALGAEAYPLTAREQASVLQVDSGEENSILLGFETRSDAPLKCGLSQLLGRHVAVLGSTGQGKSCFTAAVLQQMLGTFEDARIVVFDINGEYGDALSPHVPASRIETSVLGGASPTFKIPYFALGRHGMSRLLLPSEKTQRPALMFAIEALKYVEWFTGQGGAGPPGAQRPVLFADCRSGDATGAASFIGNIRSRTATPAAKWPNMRALACLVADSHALKPGRQPNSFERDAFAYGNVAPLVTRIGRLIEDPQFRSVVDVDGGAPTDKDLNWQIESQRLCERIFGTKETKWKLHIVDLRNVAQDLMPMVLGSLLEVLAGELFRRGQGETFPTLLVLEEAHHYLRQVTDPGEEGSRNALAYERLAKEGRKFGLSLWLSTQRPSEVSPTVLAQCGTWVAFRLTSDQDLKAVASAGEWVDRQELQRMAGLPRQQALVFGAGVSIPARIRAPQAAPTPLSHDPNFELWRGKSTQAAHPRDESFSADVQAPSTRTS